MKRVRESTCDAVLLQGWADLGGDGASIEEAHAYSYPLVVAEQPESEPQINDSFSGDLIP